MNQTHIKNEPNTVKDESTLKKTILAQNTEKPIVTGTTVTNGEETNDGTAAIKKETPEIATIEQLAEHTGSRNELGIDDELEEEDELDSEYEDESDSSSTDDDGEEESVSLNMRSSSAIVGNSDRHGIQNAKSKSRGRKRIIRETNTQVIRECLQCRKKYNTINGYQMHMQKVHNQRMPTVQPAKRSRRRRPAVNQDITSMGSTTNYITDPYIRCQVCAQPFITQYDYEEHMVQIHHVSPDLFEPNTEQTDSTSLYCDTCQLSYTTMEEYSNHVEDEHSTAARKKTRKKKGPPSKKRAKRTAESPNRYTFEEPVPDIRCRFCQVEGFNSTSYRDHLQKSHMTRLLPMVDTLLDKVTFYNNMLPTCDECDVTLYDSVKDCLAHYKEAHQIDYVLGQGFVYRKEALMEYLKAGGSTQ